MPKLQSNAPVASGGGRRAAGQPKYTSNMGQSPLGPKPPSGRNKDQVRHVQTSSAPATPAAYAAMLADPLHAPVVGKPDYNALATNVCRVRDVVDVITNSSGQAAMALGAGVFVSDRTAPTITAGAVSAWGTATSSSHGSSISTDSNLYRTLCHVVEWQPTLSDLNASGKVFIGSYVAGLSDIPLQTLASFFDDDGLTATAKDNLTFINRPMGELPFHSTNSVEPAPSFAQVVVIITGMPPTAQTVGQLIVTRIVEMIPNGVTLARFSATHTPCDLMDCCCAANLVGPGVTRATGPDAYEKMLRHGKRILGTAMRLYSAYSTSGASELRRLIAGN